MNAEKYATLSARLDAIERLILASARTQRGGKYTGYLKPYKKKVISRRRLDAL